MIKSEILEKLHNKHSNLEFKDIETIFDIFTKKIISSLEHDQKIERFSSIAANAYHEVGIKSSIFKILWHPSWAFFKAYFMRLGFLDGYSGWVICLKTFKMTYLKYVKLQALYKHQKN